MFSQWFNTWPQKNKDLNEMWIEGGWKNKKCNSHFMLDICYEIN